MDQKSWSQPGEAAPTSDHGDPEMGLQKPDPEKRMMDPNTLFRWKPDMTLKIKCRRCKKLKGKAKNVKVCQFFDGPCKNVKKLQRSTPTPTDQISQLQIVPTNHTYKPTNCTLYLQYIPTKRTYKSYLQNCTYKIVPTEKAKEKEEE